MLLYFNKNGQLLEQLEYGSVPRVGMTTFQIYAYFDLGTQELDTSYGAALIRFKRPDLNGSEYPDLFMTRDELNYDASIANPTNSPEFTSLFTEANNPYQVFKFDFNTVFNAPHVRVKLLDTPGMWEASITLVSINGGNNVTGLVRFRVEGAVSDADEEPTELDLSVLEDNISGPLAQKLNIWNGIMVVSSFPTSEELANFTEGQIFYQPSSKSFKRYVGGELINYQIIDIIDALNTFVVLNVPPEDLSLYGEGQIFYIINTKEYKRKYNNELINFEVHEYATSNDINDLF